MILTNYLFINNCISIFIIYKLELQIVSEMLRVNTGCSCYCQHNNAPHWAGSSGTMSLYQGWIYLQEHRAKIDLLQRESDLQWMRSRA